MLYKSMQPPQSAVSQSEGFAIEVQEIPVKVAVPDERPAVPSKHDGPLTPISSNVQPMIHEAVIEASSLNNDHPSARTTKALRPLKAAKSFGRKPSVSTLESVPASPREVQDFVVTPLAPRPTQQRPSITPPPHQSRGPSPTELPSRSVSRQDDVVRNPAFRPRSQSQPPNATHGRRPLSPHGAASGLRTSQHPAPAQSLNLTDPNIYSSTALAYSTSSLKSSATSNTMNRFSLALKQVKPPTDNISSVIPGSVSRHPVALHGVPLSPANSVPVISIKEAQKRAKGQKPTRKETSLRNTILSTAQSEDKRSGMMSPTPEMKRKHSFARFMGKLKGEKHVAEKNWDWI